MKKVIHISRLALIWILALQVLNLSVCNQASEDNGYDYSYAYNIGYDPTETAVEWLVEMNYGQQQTFTYTNKTDTNKSSVKTFHWQIGLDEILIQAPVAPVEKTSHIVVPGGRVLSGVRDPLTPPPDQANG